MAVFLINLSLGLVAWRVCVLTSGAEEGLNAAVVELKDLLGEGCPWVGAVVRRVAQLHQIKGDAIMAEGLYGGGGGRLEALGSVRTHAALMSEGPFRAYS